MHAVTARSDPVARPAGRRCAVALAAAPAQPREEHLPDHEAEDHEQRARGDAEHVERRLRWASQMPQVASPLNPKLSRMTATAARIAPVQSIVSPGCAGTFFTRKLSSEVDGRERDHEHERPAPADRGGEPAGEDQGEHARCRDGCGEEADRPGLLRAVVVRGDEHREGGCDERDDRTRRRLRDEQHRGAHAERDAEHRTPWIATAIWNTPRVPNRGPTFAPSRMNAAMANVPAVMAVPTDRRGRVEVGRDARIDTVSAFTANDAWICVSTTTMSGSQMSSCGLGRCCNGHCRVPSSRGVANSAPLRHPLALTVLPPIA